MRIRRDRWPVALFGSFLLLIVWWWDGRTTGSDGAPRTASAEAASSSGNQELLAAAAAQRSGVWLTGSGLVTRLLEDDTRGDQHQRWIVEVAPGKTVLIAHNIDLVERVPIRLGDRVSFRGRYEWNDRGGVLHWTHRDPVGRQPGGWIIHREKKYR